MGKGRLEAFSDGVLAIILTVMVLEMKVPQGDTLAALLPVTPTFLAYVLSFVYVGVYWSNHHHLLHTVRQVTGPILWSNLALLFWLSLFPFTAAWMGTNHFAALPTALYGGVLLMAALSWLLLQKQIIAADGEVSLLREALGQDRKGKFSIACYVAGMLLAFHHPWIGQALYTVVAAVWFVPDRRIERVLTRRGSYGQHPAGAAAPPEAS